MSLPGRRPNVNREATVEPDPAPVLEPILAFSSLYPCIPVVVESLINILFIILLRCLLLHCLCKEAFIRGVMIVQLRQGQGGLSGIALELPGTNMLCTITMIIHIMIQGAVSRVGNGGWTTIISRHRTRAVWSGARA